MEDNRTQGREATQVETADKQAADNHYEIDLDEHAPADIDEAFKDAVAAVDRTRDEGGDSASAPESEEETAEDSKLASEASSLRERLMRTLADFDNYRKRAEREKQTLRRFANFDVFKDFLGVLDNFERAMDSSGSTEDLKQGLSMIVRQQEEILRRHGVKRIDAVNKPFDPKVHEAVGREESTEVEVPTVKHEMQRGYLLHDRLLRPAMVFVTMPVSKPVAEPDAARDGIDEETGEPAG